MTICSKTLVGAAFFAVTMVCAGSTGHAFERETTNDPMCAEGPGLNCPHLGTPLFWDATEFPVRFSVNAIGSGLGFGTVSGAVENAFETWEDGSREGITFQFFGSTTSRSDGQDGTNTVSFTSLPGDSFARTIITFGVTSGRIFDADIELNSDFEYAVLPNGQDNPADPRVDIQSVVTHEAGHLLGLDHENTEGTAVVMYFNDSTGTTQHRNLTGDDRDGVRAIYGTGSGSGGGDGGGGGCAIVRDSHSSADAGVVSGVLAAWLAVTWWRRRRVATRR